RPHWDPQEVTLQLFTDGITNKLIGCYVGNTMEDVVLVRIYGNKTELLVDRDEEVKSFRVLQAHGCAPQLYCTFNNGLCYEFIQGEALDPKHVCNPAIFRSEEQKRLSSKETVWKTFPNNCSTWMTTSLSFAYSLKAELLCRALQ
ncbi:ethanolamine kinase 1, partial [Homo sapiens]